MGAMVLSWLPGEKEFAERIFFSSKKHGIYVFIIKIL